MFANILKKAKELMVLALDKAVAAWNRFASWLTVDQAQNMVAILALSGIACLDLVGLSFAMPFFIGAAVLIGLIVYARLAGVEQE